MAGYLVAKTGRNHQFTAGDILTLADSIRKRRITHNTPVHIGFVEGEVVLAIPTTVTKTQLPPGTRPDKEIAMKPARRSRR